MTKEPGYNYGVNKIGIGYGTKLDYMNTKKSG